MAVVKKEAEDIARHLENEARWIATIQQKKGLPVIGVMNAAEILEKMTATPKEVIGFMTEIEVAAQLLLDQ